MTFRYPFFLAHPIYSWYKTYLISPDDEWQIYINITSQHDPLRKCIVT